MTNEEVAAGGIFHCQEVLHGSPENSLRRPSTHRDRFVGNVDAGDRLRPHGSEALPGLSCSSRVPTTGGAMAGQKQRFVAPRVIEVASLASLTQGGPFACISDERGCSQTQ